MPRPFKCRRVFFNPEYTYFKPAGLPLNSLEEINLTLDELEAIRLADKEGMYQEEAAKKMNVSRQTFGNIISSAHKKVADFLLEGKALKIKGGEVKVMERKFLCIDCKKEWTLPFGTGRLQECPECGSKNVYRSQQHNNAKNCFGKSCYGWGWRRKNI